MKAADTSGDAITGGYLMEMDVLFDEANKFHSSIYQLPYMFKAPDEEDLQVVQFEYFQNYISNLENCLSSENWLDNREYVEYLDIGSFIDWWFVYELAMNDESKWPKSAYVYKDRLGKLQAGPVWDFDWETFIPSRSNSFMAKDFIYYNRLFQDPVFVEEVKRRWDSYKYLFSEVPDYIRDVASYIRRSNDTDYTMWPLSAHEFGSVNGDSELSFDDAINRIINSYISKLDWLDEQITNM